MKKSIAILGIAVVFASCNSTGTKSGSDANSGAGVTSTSADSTASTMTSNITDSTMAMKNGKMQVISNGSWSPMDKTYTCTDGCKVMPDGQVIMKNGKKMMLKEGEMVEKNGSMLDAQGNMKMNENMDDSMHK